MIRPERDRAREVFRTNPTTAARKGASSQKKETRHALVESRMIHRSEVARDVRRVAVDLSTLMYSTSSLVRTQLASTALSVYLSRKRLVTVFSMMHTCRVSSQAKTQLHSTVRSVQQRITTAIKANQSTISQAFDPVPPRSLQATLSLTS